MPNFISTRFAWLFVVAVAGCAFFIFAADLAVKDVDPKCNDPVWKTDVLAVNENGQAAKKGNWKDEATTDGEDCTIQKDMQIYFTQNKGKTTDQFTGHFTLKIKFNGTPVGKQFLHLYQSFKLFDATGNEIFTMPNVGGHYTWPGDRNDVNTWNQDFEYPSNLYNQMSKVCRRPCKAEKDENPK
jgi:hypothetical protein